MWRQILADIGSIASVVSLLLTGYIAWNLRNIRNNYIFRLKAPEFIKALTKHASNLNAYGNDFENLKLEAGDELAKLDVKLRSIQGRMRGEAKKSVKRLRELIEEYHNEPDSKERFRLVYRETQRVVEEVRESREDLNLE